MRVWLLVPAFLAGCAAAFGADASLTLTATSLGQVRIGASDSKLEEFLRRKLPSRSEYEGSCIVVSSLEAQAIGVSYMLEEGHVTRINIDFYGTAASASPVRTEAGIGLGATEDEVKRAYGDRLRVEPNSNDPAWHNLIVDQPDHSGAIIFDTNGKTVVSIRAGQYPSVAYTESCR